MIQDDSNCFPFHSSQPGTPRPIEDSYGDGFVGGFDSDDDAANDKGNDDDDDGDDDEQTEHVQVIY